MTMPQKFSDRTAAGRALARRLLRFRAEAPLVLGLPRGGVPVAREVARALGAPLDVWVVRKVGAPAQPELGMGAVAEGGEVFIDAEAVRYLGVSPAKLRSIVDAKTAEVEERARLFRQGRPLPDVRGKTVIVVDDGLATGGTARAALRALRARGPARLVLAVPVGSSDSLRSAAADADQVVCLAPVDDLVAVGFWYDDFGQVEDAEVIAILEAQRRGFTESAEPAERTFAVRAAGATLLADLSLPPDARGLVVFAHGSGSGRKSPRNRLVARMLQRAGLATVLVDLLTEDEQREDAHDARLRFDIALLGTRLIGVIDALRLMRELRHLPLGCYGASTGAAAALIAAAARPATVRAVVSRGGRPDLAGDALESVEAPTLLVVGGADQAVLSLNREALERLGGAGRLETVPGANHLFEEPGTLERAGELAAAWFATHLEEDRATATPLVEAAAR